MSMNIHHLELFYYVATHGGISEAVRKMPYGIQQPAVSGQMILLEEYLGATLFRRRPFQLTPPGEELYQFIRPFFDQVEAVAGRIRGGVEQTVRIGASQIVLRDHLPLVLQQLRQRFPKLKLTLREGYHADLVAAMQRQELDVSITLFESKPPSGMQSLHLLDLPLVLLVPKASKLKSAEDLWRQDRISETLITVPAGEPVCRNFQEGLARLKVDWFTGIEVSALDLVQTYVANGYGAGVSVLVPKGRLLPGVRTLPLDGFEPIRFGLLWQGRGTPLVQALVETVREAVRVLIR
jgi:DNA-binding transcriptional LysR family regulator